MMFKHASLMQEHLIKITIKINNKLLALKYSQQYKNKILHSKRTKTFQT